MSDIENLGIANVVITEVSDESSPAVSFGGAAHSGNSQTGLYGGYSSFGASVKAAQILNIDEDGMHMEAPILGPSLPYSGSASFQPIGPDLELAAGAGKAAPNTAYLAPVMGNLIGDSLTKSGNYLGGVIGAYSVTGALATSFPSGAVLAQITDGVSDAAGAVVAYVDGDSAVTKANAAFKAMSNNSTAGSGFNYGLDLTSPAHDGFSALAILKADIRCSNEVCFLNGAGAPVDGTTGLNFAGPGSFYIDTSAKKAYINGGSKAVPAWKIITSA